MIWVSGWEMSVLGFGASESWVLLDSARVYGWRVSGLRAWGFRSG